MSSIYKLQKYLLPDLAEAADTAEIPFLGKYLDKVSEFIESHIADDIRYPERAAAAGGHIPTLEETMEREKKQPKKKDEYAPGGKFAKGGKYYYDYEKEGPYYSGAGSLGPGVSPNIRPVRKLETLQPSRKDRVGLQKTTMPLTPLIPHHDVAPAEPIMTHYGFSEHYDPIYPEIKIHRGSDYQVSHAPKLDQPNASMFLNGGFTKSYTLYKRPETVSGFSGKIII